MPNFRKILRHIDLLVTPYEFNVTKSQKSLTKLGGVFSLIILMLMIIYSVSIFTSTISKTGSIYAGTQIQSEIEKLDQNSSLVVIQLSYALNGDIIEFDSELTSYFSISIYYVHQIRQENSTTFQRNFQSLNFTICQQEQIDKFNFHNRASTKEETQEYLCFQGNYNLQGSFFEQTYDYLKISVDKCENDIKCKSNDEFKTFIDQGININLFILDSKIKQTLDIAEPSQQSSYTIFWRLNSGIANSEDVYLQPIIIDYINNKNSFSMFQGNVDSRERIFNSSRVERQERRQYPINLYLDKNLCTFYIRTSSDSQYFFAQKSDITSVVLDAISQASGLSVAILGFAKILYKIYIEHETYIKVMNQVFKFDFRDSVAVRNNNFQTNLQIDKKKTLDQLFKNQLDFSFFTHLQIRLTKHFKSFSCCNCCCKKDYEKKVLMAQMAKAKIMSDLELTNIVKKLYEIDCLKLLLFDDDQLKLFNSFSQPVLQKNIVEQKEIFKKINKKDIERLNQNNSIAEKYTLKHQPTEQIDFEEAVESTIPIEFQLQKISRFFKAQIKAQNSEELLDIYANIVKGKNHNEKMNERLLNFIKYNNILYQMVDFTHQKKCILENPISSQMNNQLLQENNIFQTQNFEAEKQQPPSQSLQISIPSSPKRGYIKQNKGDNQVEQIDFDEIKISLDTQNRRLQG